MNYKLALISILILGLLGCGSPAKTTPVAPPLPNIAGTWSGTVDMDNMTPKLVMILTEDDSGKLAGTVSSTSGCSCDFTVDVTGAIYTNYTFSVQTEDGTLSLAGSLANNDVAISGYMNIGNGPYKCGPATGRPFALAKE